MRKNLYAHISRMQWRRAVGFLLMCMLLISPFKHTSMATAGEGEEEIPAITGGTAATATIASAAKAAVLVEANTQQIIIENHAETLCDVAGLSKMPAILVLVEAVDAGRLDLNTSISVSRHAAGIGGPTAFIESGESIGVEALMKAAIMIGAGDAIVAMGEHLFGSETAFLDTIHNRLDALSIPVRLQDSVGIGAQFSPAMLARVGAAMMESNCFKKFSSVMLDSIRHADGRETELASSNRMLRNYAGCGGVMTGSSPADGYSGVFSVVRGDTHLIAAVIGCKNSASRFQVAEEMLGNVFATTRAQKLSTAGEVLFENIRVKGGREKTIALVAKETIVLLLDKAAPALEPLEDIPKAVQAPLSGDEVLGTITYQTADGKSMGKVELVAQKPVEAYSYMDIVKEILSCFIRL